jgi:ribosome-associated translation inhibitor RaiA
MVDDMINGMDAVLDDLEEQYRAYKEKMLEKLGFKPDEIELPKPEMRHFR